MPNGENEVVKGVVKNLGAFFRHLLPGVIIVGAAYVAHRNWFCNFNPEAWQHIAVLAAIVLAVGNTWFAINRYAVHQFIDMVLYWRGVPGPPRTGNGYHKDLGEYAKDSLCSEKIPRRARDHVAFRASSVLLLYIVGEVGVIFCLCPAPSTVFSEHRYTILATSVAIFVLGIWQDIITKHIDAQIVTYKHDP